MRKELILESRIMKYGRKLDFWILGSKWNSFRNDIIFKNHCLRLRIFLIISTKGNRFKLMVALREMK